MCANSATLPMPRLARMAIKSARSGGVFIIVASSCVPFTLTWIMIVPVSFMMATGFRALWPIISFHPSLLHIGATLRNEVQANGAYPEDDDDPSLYRPLEEGETMKIPVRIPMMIVS